MTKQDINLPSFLLKVTFSNLVGWSKIKLYKRLRENKIKSDGLHGNIRKNKIAAFTKWDGTQHVPLGIVMVCQLNGN